MTGERFITLFYLTTNVHLIKEVGMIPYNMHKVFQYDARIVSYKCERDIYLKRGLSGSVAALIDPSYKYLKKEVKGLKMEFIEDTGRLFFLEKSVLRYLFQNSRSISVLNLYFLNPASFVYGLIYKFLNPRGFLYIKADMNLNFFLEKSKSALFKGKVRILNLLAKWIDLISLETTLGVRLLRQMVNKKAGKRISYVPSGIDEGFIRQNSIKTKGWDEKEDVILTVGRIGDRQKNTEMLLRAVEKTELGRWKVLLVGAVEPAFRPVIRDFFRRNPGLKKKVVFTGNISDRVLINRIFNRSKIFCLTSSWESFGIVLAEALYFGAYPVATDIPPARDITAGGKLGTLVPVDDAGKLAGALRKLIRFPGIMKRQYKERIEYTRSHFLWEKIVGTIEGKIREKRGG